MKIGEVREVSCCIYNMKFNYVDFGVFNRCIVEKGMNLGKGVVCCNDKIKDVCMFVFKFEFMIFFFKWNGMRKFMFLFDCVCF